MTSSPRRKHQRAETTLWRSTGRGCWGVRCPIVLGVENTRWPFKLMPVLSAASSQKPCLFNPLLPRLSARGRSEPLVSRGQESNLGRRLCDRFETCPEVSKITKVVQEVRGHIGPLRRDSWENLKLDSSSASALKARRPFLGLKGCLGVGPAGL